MTKILKFVLNDNHSAFIALLIAAAVIVIFYGCQSTVPAYTDPAKKLTRLELEAEYQYVTSQFEAKFAALDRQDMLKQLIIDRLNVVSEQPGFNGWGLLPLVVAAASIGFGLDGRRKALIAQTPPKPTEPAA